MKFPKIKFKKIKNFLRKIPLILAERAFHTFLILFCFSLLVGFLIYLRCNSLIEKTEKIQITEKEFRFQEEIYQNVIKFWEEKEKRFKETDFKEYENPFVI